MTPDEFLRDIDDLCIYTGTERAEFFGCFEGIDGLRERHEPESLSGELLRRIRGAAVRDDARCAAISSPKIVAIESLAARLRREPAPLGIVSGCFDLLHLGHLRGFRHARSTIASEGGLLAALVLSDAAIRAKKGEGRPVMTLHERLHLLARVRFLDFVVPLDDHDCRAAMRQLHPCWFFKSPADLSQEIVRREIDLVRSMGGEVCFLPRPAGAPSSTTALLRSLASREHVTERR